MEFPSLFFFSLSSSHSHFAITPSTIKYLFSFSLFSSNPALQIYGKTKKQNFPGHQAKPFFFISNKYLLLKNNNYQIICNYKKKSLFLTIFYIPFSYTNLF